MKSINALFSIGVLSCATMAALPDSLSLHAKISIQAIKYAGPSESATSQSGNNFDVWWGRAVASANYHSPGLESQIEVYMYPSGFGFEPLIKADIVADSVDSNSLVTETAEVDLIMLSNAWVSFPLGAIRARIGRFESYLGSGTGFFGDYVDEGFYSGFNAKGSTHNGVDIYHTYGSNYTSIMVQSGDKYLNTGRVRFQQGYHTDKINLDFGYRFNAIDFIHTENHAKPEHRVHLAVALGESSAWRIYAEPAGIWTEKEGLDKVILVGANIPGMGLLDQISVEAEYVFNREVIDDDGMPLEKPILWNIQVARNLGTYLQAQASLFADPLGASIMDVGCAARVTAQLWRD